MNTRRVEPGARRTQHGWASAPEFEELRGLSGSAVAFKAALVEDPRLRSLLFFLQAQSRRDGGINRLVDEIIKTIPDLIGSETMIKIGCQPGQRLSQRERDTIEEELNPSRENLLDELVASEMGRSFNKPEREHSTKSANDFIEECRSLAKSGLGDFIEALCCDPKLVVNSTGTNELFSYREKATAALESVGQYDRAKEPFEHCSLRYLHNSIGSLCEFQQRYEQRVSDEFVETSIGCKVFEALEYVLETGKSALIEGDSGRGKTTALKAWTEMHLGVARYVELKGITHRTGFFQELAKAFGIARGSGLSASKVQVRVEQFLQRTKMLLIIDEGQYLLAAGNRVNTPPELINWLLTACYNQGVPFVISATSEFRARRAIVEKNTTWQSEQLRRRIRRHFELPSIPTKDDLTRVARKLLVGMDSNAVDFVVGYSMTSKGFFQTITDAIDDAHLIARRAGRNSIRFADLKAAIQDWRAPSDAALQRVFEKKTETRRGRPQITPIQPQIEPFSEQRNTGLNRIAEPLQAPGRTELSLVDHD